ncbi:MAG: cell wall metabolism sensor histidine kinase WalK [Firmicutes bacterium]|nr:cell wall metabolism sensor histidine kinase WalK [Bacillota bacterium]
MKRSISSKIISTYLVILVVSLGASGFLFNSMVRTFLVREVQNSMQKEGAVLVGLFKKTPLGSLKTDYTGKRVTFRLVNRLFEGNYFITDLAGKVVFSNRPAVVRIGSIAAVTPMRQIITGKVANGVFPVNDKQLVTVSLPFKSEAGVIKGALVMYTELKGVQILGTSIIRVLMRVLLIVSLLTIIIGIFLARSISKPVKMLEAGARRLGERDFDSRLTIRTGDELEQLGNTFNNVALQLQSWRPWRRYTIFRKMTLAG